MVALGGPTCRWDAGLMIGTYSRTVTQSSVRELLVEADGLGLPNGFAHLVRDSQKSGLVSLRSRYFISYGSAADVSRMGAVMVKAL
jgi:hypothetical protein